MKEILSNWTKLNAALVSMPEPAARKLLLYAQRRNAAPAVLLRIHSRYNKVRAERERKQLIQGK